MADLGELAERLRQFALSLPETYEDEPWGHPVFKVGDNKMFGQDRISVHHPLEKSRFRPLAWRVSPAPFVSEL